MRSRWKHILEDLGKLEDKRMSFLWYQMRGPMMVEGWNGSTKSGW